MLSPPPCSPLLSSHSLRITFRVQPAQRYLPVKPPFVAGNGIIRVPRPPPPLPQCSPRVIQVVVPPPLINNRRRIDPNLSTAASTSHVRFCAVKSARVAEALKTSDRRASERSAGQCAPRARLSSPLLGEVNKNFVSEPRPQRTCNCRPTTTTTTPQSPTPSSPLSCPDTYSVLS